MIWLVDESNSPSFEPPVITEKFIEKEAIKYVLVHCRYLDTYIITFNQ